MPLVRFTFAILLAASTFAAENNPGTTANGLVAHEWGTFTSVAGPDGYAVPWSTRSGQGDLPCFVIGYQPQFKYESLARIRMETPVIYFYSPRPATATVKVFFRNGTLTEWFPNAIQDTVSRLEWRNVEILPGADLKFPGTNGRSHYYTARDTDAAPLRVRNQNEKMLFYRGVGDFDPDLHPRIAAGGAIELEEAPEAPAILFENRGGRMGFRVITGTRVDPPELISNVGAVKAAIVERLVEAGLYPKEARAMVETWGDAWFEEGMRVLYLVSRRTVDSNLPLDIAPQPQEVARVFVGRIEMLSPAMRETIAAAVAAKDMPTLWRYGRFLNPFLEQMRVTARLPQPSPTPGCVQ